MIKFYVYLFELYNFDVSCLHLTMFEKFFFFLQHLFLVVTTMLNLFRDGANIFPKAASRSASSTWFVLMENYRGEHQCLPLLIH
jgi:hypothetical protein